MRHPLAQRHLAAGADHAGQADQLLHHVLQVRVVAGHDAGQEVAAARDGEGLDDLRHRRQRLAHLVQMSLGDLDVHEREHRVAQGGGGEGRSGAGDHAVALQPVQPGLEGAAGDPEETGVLAHARARLLEQQSQDAGVELVDGHRASGPSRRPMALPWLPEGRDHCTNGPLGRRPVEPLAGEMLL